jgi:hypothetical protein
VKNIKLLIPKSFMFWEKFTKSIFSWFYEVKILQTFTHNKLTDSSAYWSQPLSFQLHLCNSIHRVSTIPGYLKTYCCFVRSDHFPERWVGGPILIMHYNHCKTPWLLPFVFAASFKFVLVKLPSFQVVRVNYLHPGSLLTVFGSSWFLWRTSGSCSSKKT